MMRLKYWVLALTGVLISFAHPAGQARANDNRDAPGPAPAATENASGDGIADVPEFSPANRSILTAPHRLPPIDSQDGLPGTEVENGSTAEPFSSGIPAESGAIRDNVQSPPLTPQLIDLRERVRDCLGYYYNQHERVADHSPWGIMHVVIAYGADTQIYTENRKVNGISYLCWNGNCRGQQLFFVNRGGLETRVGPGVQGHDGQFLAIVAQSRVKQNYPLQVDGQDFTIADLIRYEQRTCRAGTELTFKLIGLAHYLESEATWTNDKGEDWSISRLIREELAQPIIGAACGGTHRLTGFAYAVAKREKEGKPMTGQFLRARKFLDDYFEYTYYLQNDDGSFSTDFFRGRNGYGSIDSRIETTGHMLEFMVAALSKEQLRDPRIIKSVEYLTDLMWQNRTHSWEIGPKGHALHALAIYDERLYGDVAGNRAHVLSRQAAKRPAVRPTR